MTSLIEGYNDQRGCRWQRCFGRARICWVPLAWIPRRLTITRLCTRSSNSNNSNNFNNIPPNCIWLIICSITTNCKSVPFNGNGRVARSSEKSTSVGGNGNGKSGGLCSGATMRRERNDDSPFQALSRTRVIALSPIRISVRYALSVLSLELFTNFVTRHQGTGRVAFVFVAQGPVVPSFLKPYNLFPPPRRRV